jgi:hypothetical protein
MASQRRHPTTRRLARRRIDPRPASQVDPASRTEPTIATFSIAYRNYQMRLHSEQLRQKLDRETGGQNTIPAKVRWTVDPADYLTLRGIPAVGRGVAGAIAGTKPESITRRDT